MASKLAKKAVRYRWALGRKRCGTCIMFREPGRCTLVAGRISKAATCDRYVPCLGCLK